MAISHRRIRVSPFFTRAVALDAFRCRIELSDAHELSNACFAYREIPLRPGQTRAVAIFDHVCSPVDLADFPLDAPRVNSIPPWFRLSWVEFDSPTREQAFENYNAIVADLAGLIAALDNAEIMVAEAPFWLGYDPTADGSSVGSSDGSLS